MHQTTSRYLCIQSSFLGWMQENRDYIKQKEKNNRYNKSMEVNMVPTILIADDNEQLARFWKYAKRKDMKSLSHWMAPTPCSSLKPRILM